MTYFLTLSWSDTSSSDSFGHWKNEGSHQKHRYEQYRETKRSFNKEQNSSVFEIAQLNLPLNQITAPEESKYGEERKDITRVKVKEKKDDPFLANRKENNIQIEFRTSGPTNNVPNRANTQPPETVAVEKTLKHTNLISLSNYIPISHTENLQFNAANFKDIKRYNKNSEITNKIPSHRATKSMRNNPPASLHKSMKHKIRNLPKHRKVKIPPSPLKYVDFQAVPFDVPKLGVPNQNDPPEVLFTEMFAGATKPTEKSDNEGMATTMKTTLPPFLPTPNKPEPSIKKRKTNLKKKRRKLWGRKIKFPERNEKVYKTKVDLGKLSTEQSYNLFEKILLAFVQNEYHTVTSVVNA